MTINIQILYKTFVDMAEYMESVSEHDSATSYRICASRIHDVFLPIIEKPMSKITEAERKVDVL